LDVWTFEDNLFNFVLAYQDHFCFSITLDLADVLPIVFVKEYENAYAQKQQILLENKGKTGIY
jgi:hypothetical protein